MDGILPLWKPEGMTSHDCVARIRALTRQKKIGHTGTLDPDARGVLPLCLGAATKVVKYMTDDVKTYEAEMVLGTATTTEDQSGDVVAEKPVEHPISRDEIVAALQQWTGRIEQIPPMYSAVKVRGKRLYEYAREGITVDRPKRHVTVYESELLDDRETFSGERVSFSIRVRCSKGTYIRTLVVDIGHTLGYPAHLARLVRTSSGSLTLQDCFSLAEVENMVDRHTLQAHLLPMDRGLSSLERITVDEKTASKMANGAVLPLRKGMAENLFSVYNEDGTLIAVYRRHPGKSGWMKPDKVFATKEFDRR